MTNPLVEDKGSSATLRTRWGMRPSSGPGAPDFLWAIEIAAEPVAMARIVLVLDCFSASPVHPDAVTDVLDRLIRLGVHPDAPVGVFRCGDAAPILPWNRLKDWLHAPDTAGLMRRRELARPAATLAGFIGSVVDAVEGSGPGAGVTIAFILGDGDLVDAQPCRPRGWRWFRVGEFGDSKPAPRLGRVLPGVAAFTDESLNCIDRERLANAVLCACKVEVTPREGSMLTRAGASAALAWPDSGPLTHDFRRGSLTIFGRSTTEPLGLRVHVTSPAVTFNFPLVRAKSEDALATEAGLILERTNEPLVLSESNLVAEADSEPLRGLISDNSKRPLSGSGGVERDGAVSRKLFDDEGVRAALVVDGGERLWALKLRGAAGPWCVPASDGGAGSIRSHAMTIRLSDAGDAARWSGEWAADGFRQDIAFYAATLLKRPLFTSGTRELPAHFVARSG